MRDSQWTEEFYYCDKKIKNVISQGFTSIITSSNLIHFCEKIGFKSASGSFGTISRHLRTILRKLKEMHTYPRYLCGKVILII